MGTLKDKLNGFTRNVFDREKLSGNIMKVAPFAGAGYLTIHLLRDYNKNERVSAWPAILGSILGYYSGPVFLEKSKQLIVDESKEKDWYSLLLKFVAFGAGGLIGADVGQKIVVDYLKKQPEVDFKNDLADELLNSKPLINDDLYSADSDLFSDTIQDSVPGSTSDSGSHDKSSSLDNSSDSSNSSKYDAKGIIPSLLVVPSTVLSLELLPKPFNSSYQQRILSGLGGGFAGQVMGRRFESKLKETDWQESEISDVYNFSKTGGALLGGLLGGTVSYQVMKKIILG